MKKYTYGHYEKLTAMPYAQAKVGIVENGSYLVSYSTLAAQIKDGWLMVNGLYSATTRRHIGAYVQEYANTTYQVAKRCFEERLNYNIYTGEFMSRVTGEILA